MSEVLEYYLTGGHLQLGKKEAALELLRRDSILRALLGYTAGELKALASGSAHVDKTGDAVCFDFTGIQERRLGGDPAALLKELKARYGRAVSGQLFFRIVYTTFGHVFYSQADLDGDKMSMRDGV
jgi:hypothetical protein